MTTQKIKIGDTWYPVNQVIAIEEGDGGGGVTDHGLLSGLEGDDHTQYLNNARGDVRYDAAGTAAAGDASHVNATNPHPEYLTPAEGNAAYDSIGTAAAGDASHVADGDPHSQYLTPAEGDAAYAPQGHQHSTTETNTWTYDTNNTIADPSTGKFRGNNTDTEAATILAISNTTNTGWDYGGLLASLDTGDIIAMQQENDSSKNARFNVTGAITDHGDWVEVPVILTSTTGATISKNESIILRFTIAGEEGGGGVTDHGALTGLENDDHPQYLLKAGDTMTGPLTLPDGDPAASTGYVDAVGVKASYTPRWHQDGGATLSIGDGSLIGTWERVGNFVHASIVLLRGSTTNQGSAPYLWDLPIPAADYRAITGSAYAFDSSAVTWQPCIVVAISDQTVRLITTGTRERVGPDVPWSWDIEDSIAMNVEYSV